MLAVPFVLVQVASSSTRPSQSSSTPSQVASVVLVLTFDGVVTFQTPFTQVCSPSWQADPSR